MNDVLIGHPHREGQSQDEGGGPVREHSVIGQRQLRRTPPSHRMLEETPALFVNRCSVGPHPTTREQEARVARLAAGKFL
jgi:hypothetical protein